MKTKRFPKKLVLKKTTVANLNKQEMNALQGGATELTCGPTWETCDPKRCGYTFLQTCTCTCPDPTIYTLDTCASCYTCDQSYCC